MTRDLGLQYGSSPMSGSDLVELRRTPRVNAAVAVLRRAPHGVLSEQGVNLSAGGMALASSVPLLPGSSERLLLSSQDGRVRVTLEAQVVRVQTAGPRQYVSGLRFGELDTRAAAGITAIQLEALRTPQGERSGPRVDVMAQAFWSAPGASGARALQLVNFSQSGALVRGEPMPVPAGRGLFSVRHEETGAMVTVPAETVWQREDADACFTGLRFNNHPSAAAVVAEISRSLLVLHRSPSALSNVPALSARVGGFELGSLVARGRWVEVYHARALKPDPRVDGATDVSLKRFAGQPVEVESWTRRFLAAVELGRHLYEHPGVLRTFAAMGDTRECWLVSERVLGTSLEQALDERHRNGQLVPLDAIVSIVRKVLTTLDDCHRHVLARNGNLTEVLHGDLRPSNVLVTANGEVKLMGFGAAFRPVAGRLGWLPPEVLAGGSPTRRSDLYQVGVLLYASLTGSLPFQGSTLAQLQAAIAEGAAPPSTLNPEVPERLDTVVLSALAADPNARPASCAALADALSELEPTSPSARAIRRELIAPKGREAVVPPARPRAEARPSPERGWSPGAVIGGYGVLAKLGESDRVEVFLAHAPSGNAVVLKTLAAAKPLQGDALAQLLSEARAATVLRHTNVARTLEVGLAAGRPFIATEYVAGHSLDAVLETISARGQILPAELAALIASACCAGLDAAHALGVLHQNLTARKIMIGFNGAVKLVDLGLSQLTMTGAPAHAAPEQLDGSPRSLSSDVWAVGINLYRMLTNATPPEGFTGAEPAAVRDRRADAPFALCRVVERALRRDPAQRYPSAASMRTVLERFLDVHAVGQAELRRLMGRLYPVASGTDLAVTVPPLHAMAKSRDASVK